MVSQILDFEASFGPPYRHKSGCYGLRVKCPFGKKLGSENGDRGSHIILQSGLRTFSLGDGEAGPLFGEIIREGVVGFLQPVQRKEQ